MSWASRFFPPLVKPEPVKLGCGAQWPINERAWMSQQATSEQSTVWAH